MEAAELNFNIPRFERIEKLKKRLARIENALKSFPYTNKKHILEDAVALEATQKEIEVQQAYLLLES